MRFVIKSSDTKQILLDLQIETIQNYRITKSIDNGVNEVWVYVESANK